MIVLLKRQRVEGPAIGKIHMQIPSEMPEIITLIEVQDLLPDSMASFFRIGQVAGTSFPVFGHAGHAVYAIDSAFNKPLPFQQVKSRACLDVPILFHLFFII